MQRMKGFTLIELLIVVAIIAILAAIAVPNFLEAQTRSRVARMTADMRTVATGIESYSVDYNKPPFDFDGHATGWPYYLHTGLSTPISYLTSSRAIMDVFAEGRELPSPTGSERIRERLRYRAFSQDYLTASGRPSQYTGPNLPGPDAPGNAAAQRVHGAWFIVSRGPDGRLVSPEGRALPTNFADGNVETDWFWLPYDPTNGTVSAGAIMRSQANPQPALSDYPTIPSYGN